MIHPWRLVLMLCLALPGSGSLAWAESAPRQIAQAQPPSNPQANTESQPQPRTVPTPSGEVMLTLLAAESAAANGLLDHLAAKFSAKSGVKIRIVARRIGEIVDLARQGQGDLIMFDDFDAEQAFIRAKLGTDREDVMYAEMIVVGPQSDPAKVSGMVSVIDAFRQIQTLEAPFITRNDDSSINRLERRLWEEAGLVPEPSDRSWYRPSDTDMRSTLSLAAQRGAYVLTDMATWLAFKERRTLVAQVGDDPRLQLRYSVVLLNPERFPKVRAAEARAFMRWLTSAEGQDSIQSFKVEDELPYSPHLDSKE